MLQQQAEPATGPERVTVADCERLRHHLSRAVGRLCPGLLAQSREDLVQDCLVRVLDLARRSDEDRRLAPAYLYKVAYSSLIDEIRRRRRRPESPLDDGDSVPGARSPTDPEAALAGREIRRGIFACLDRLQQDRRLAVTLYLQGHSVPEAARILDWDIKRTENLVYRALAGLRECLAAKGVTP